MTLRLAKAITMVAALLLAGTAVSVRADDARTPIGRENILSALHSSGLAIAPTQLEQLSNVTAAEPNPLLKVISVDMLDGESDKVLLRCEHPNTCLPFFVLVHWDGQEQESAARSGRPGIQPQNLLVRSGRFVTLMLDGEYIHMTMPVLCLQNGGHGQQVRVISKATKKRYLARVTGRGVVSSVLQE
jgi:hypothetical protein